MDRYNTVLALLAATAVGAGVTACGDSGRPAGSTARQLSDAAHSTTTNAHRVSTDGYLKYDSDTDADDRGDGPSADDLQEMVVAGRGGASPADRRAITKSVKRYFAAAAAVDAEKGCSLLASSVAIGLGGESGPSGATTNEGCVAALSLSYRRQHKRLTAEDPSTMVVTGVHVKGSIGLVTLGFREMPETEIVVEREGATWKPAAIFDSPLP
jgi:hypothetical protein